LGCPEALDRVHRDEVYSEGNKLRLHIFESNPGDPTVIFIPGTGAYAMAYACFMLSLCEQGFNVIGFDPRGHGQSGGMRGSYDLNELVRDTHEVISYAIERYGEKVVVSGSSQGGITAFYTAAADSRVKAAVCNGFHDPSEPDNSRLTRFPRFYKTVLPIGPIAVRLLPKHVKVPVSAYLDSKVEPLRIFGNISNFYKEDMLAVHWFDLRAVVSLGTTPLAKKVQEIDVPVMLLYAGKDTIFPADYEERIFNRLTCGKKILLLEDAPHAWIFEPEYFEEVVPEVAGWLREVL
jgi:alpha-beta hydrolase superfamily lysophospholipase